MSEESGLNSTAQSCYSTALSIAREADDRGMFGIIQRAMSVQALRMGEHANASALIHSSWRSLGPNATPAVRSFVLTQRALVHALEKQRDAALRDLASAELAHNDAASISGLFNYYPRAGLAYQRAQTLRALNYPRQAQSSFRESLRNRPRHQKAAYAITQAGLAESLIATDDLEEACVHWHIFLDHFPGRHSACAYRALLRLQRMLSAFPRQRQAELTIGRAEEVLGRLPRAMANEQTMTAP